MYTMRILRHYIRHVRNPLVLVQICKSYVRLQSKLTRQTKRTGVPPLTSVAIEINSACNRKCSFCPNSKVSRESVFLDEKLVYKIIDELREMKFKGGVSFHRYNEPLLDKRLIKFIAYTREKLPSAHIFLNTNGDALRLKLWKDLRRAGLDFANISQYDGILNENIRHILSELSFNERAHFYPNVFDTKIVSSRAGLVKSKGTPQVPLKKFCNRPFYQLSVNYEGKVVLCCNDYEGAVQFGDVSKEKVADIWKKQGFKHYRNRLMEKDRASLDVCASCDFH